MKLDLAAIRKRPVFRGSKGHNRLSEAEKHELGKLVNEGKLTLEALSRKTKCHTTSLRRWADLAKKETAFKQAPLAHALLASSVAKEALASRNLDGETQSVPLMVAPVTAKSVDIGNDAGKWSVTYKTVDQNGNGAVKALIATAVREYFAKNGVVL